MAHVFGDNYLAYFRYNLFAFSESCGGHQIPDVVYMALVDWLLDAPAGVDGELVAAVRAAYQANMMALHTMFDTLEQEHEEYTRPDSPVLSAVAAAAVYSKSSYNTLAMLVSFRERRQPGLTGVTGLPFPQPSAMATVEALASLWHGLPTMPLLRPKVSGRQAV